MQRVVVKVYGGLGNQLFCYACGYAVARYNNCDLIIDTSQQDNDSFRQVDIIKLKIPYSKRITFKKGTGLFDRLLLNRMILSIKLGLGIYRAKEKEPYCFDRDIFNINRKSIYLHGYWQSYRYFNEYRKELLSAYEPSFILSDYFKETQNKIDMCENSIAVHIRRGDYVSIGCNIENSYYDLAIERIERALSLTKTYFIFSDDISYAYEFKYKYPEFDMYVIDNRSTNSTIEDLLLMSKCRNQIIANSSYSWWAAWLNKYENKIIICPEVNSWAGDLYPEEWIKIRTEICEGK